MGIFDQAEQRAMLDRANSKIEGLDIAIHSSPNLLTGIAAGFPYDNYLKDVVAWRHFYADSTALIDNTHTVNEFLASAREFRSQAIDRGIIVPALVPPIQDVPEAPDPHSKDKDTDSIVSAVKFASGAVALSAVAWAVGSALKGRR